MPDLARFAGFARRVGAVARPCSTRSTVAPEAVLQENLNEIRRVARVAPVAPRNDDQAHEGELLDAFEERAAIMQHDGGLSRQEAEAMAWKHVFGELPRIE
jgi:hypothetical protein